MTSPLPAHCLPTASSAGVERTFPEARQKGLAVFAGVRYN